MALRWFSCAVLAIVLGSCSAPQSEPQAGSGAEAEVAAKIEAPSATITDAAASPDNPQSDDPFPSSPASTTTKAPAEVPETSPGKAPRPEANSQANSQAKPIEIDQTVCGAGGQEAYFETQSQEIYICKNDAAALTYIATPKQTGNSLFLPAQKIQQGEVVGYAALDETKTYIVTPGGFQLQDNGKAIESQKVIRRKLAED